MVQTLVEFFFTLVHKRVQANAHGYKQTMNLWLHNLHHSIYDIIRIVRIHNSMVDAPIGLQFALMKLP